MHRFVNDLQRPIGTHLYGRRLYEVMVAWETMPVGDQPDVYRDFAEMWRAADKVVFSRTLDEVSSRRTRLERNFEPEVVANLKDAATHDLLIGGPELAALALRRGLVDEVHQFLSPVVVGGGTPFLPTGLTLRLELLDERRFDNGVVHLAYRTLL